MTVLLEEPRDDVPTDRRSQLAHAFGNQTPGEIGPFHSSPHWITCGVIFENLAKVGLNGQILFDQGLASTPFFRMRSGSSTSSPSSYSIPRWMVFGSHPRTRATCSIPPYPTQLRGFNRCIPTPISFIERCKKTLHHPLDLWSKGFHADTSLTMITKPIDLIA